ncbi:transposase [Streptomyces olivaceoviridis]|uniref:transposase n=1 Tax=Streptomyces olivaceoviridis TaxID=1921 RepID=UPI0036FE7EE9
MSACARPSPGRVQAEANAASELGWDISVDSTSVRARHRAAGARHAPPPAVKRGFVRAIQGPRVRAELAELIDRPTEAERKVRRSAARGGFTTKIHPSADGRCRVLSLVITPGQCADCTQFEPVMAQIRVPRLGCGRPRTRPDSVSADKGHSNRQTRRYLHRRGIRHVTPEKRDQAANRVRCGSACGRPPGFDEDRYTKRNTV